MKRVLQLIIICLLFIPLLVNAETCDNDKVSISSITMVDKSNDVEELEEASVNGRNINLNLNMSSVNDTITYKIVIKNDSDDDFKIDDSSFNINSEFVNYRIEADDNNTVKANSSKTVNLIIEYANKVPSNQFNAGKFDNSNTMTINLSTGGLLDTLINPNTGNIVLLFICLIIMIGFIYTIIIKKKHSKLMIVIIGLIVIIPISVYAACKVELKINANIQITNKGYMPCTFDGEMVPGAEFAYGDFIYRYKQEHTMVKENMWNWHREWVDMDEDGWGVIHKDIDTNNVTGEYTPRMCSSINGKPIVSMSYTFYMMDKIEKMDVSYIDTSNVVNMSNTLYYIGGDIIPQDINDNVSVSLVGLENWDVSNVKYMDELFYGVGRFANNITISDFSKWDTSKVENMYGMFYLVGQGWESYTSSDMITNTKLNIKGFEDWDVSNVKDISLMFSLYGATAQNVYLDLSKWDVSKVENINGIFEETAAGSKTLTIKGLDKWNISNVTFMPDVFCGTCMNCESVDIGDISNWNTSKAEDMSGLFSGFCRDCAEINNFNLTNWDTRNVKDMSFMFDDFATKSNRIIDLGKVDFYADNITSFLTGSSNIKLVLNIYSNPTFSNYSYQAPLLDAATTDGSLITVNYSNNTTNIDNIIATKSENSNVVKGSLLD